MSKERLEEFREFIDFMYESIDIEDHQRFIAISESMIKDGWFKWIYRFANEQAERVQELEETNFELMEVIRLGEAQNKRYHEALEFYANENHWKEQEIEILMDGEPTRAYDTPIAIEDNGVKARKALRGDGV